MSNLNSLFDLVAGLPPTGRSALEGNFKQKAAESPILSEGMIAKIEDEAGVPVLTKLTSASIGATTPPDYPWLIMTGADQTDATVANKLTALACKSGLIFRVAHASPGGFAVGDLVFSSAGVLAKVTGAFEQAVGQVIETDATAGYIIVACGGSNT